MPFMNAVFLNTLEGVPTSLSFLTTETVELISSAVPVREMRKLEVFLWIKAATWLTSENNENRVIELPTYQDVDMPEFQCLQEQAVRKMSTCSAYVLACI
jgi:hypothetical protein